MDQQTPNPATATQLSAKGFKVLPVTDHRKFCALPEWSKMSLDQAAQALRTTNKATGWCIQPGPRDPIKLVLLDIDVPGCAADRFWRAASPVEKMPAGVALARTVSGGLHMWFRAPSGHELRKVQETFKVGDYQGDIRASANGNRALMLPGSVADGKQGRGAYTWERPLDLARLPELPVSVFNKLCAPPSHTQKVAMPTELHRLFELFFNLVPDDCVEQGTWSDRAYHLGTICARMWGREKPTESFKMVAVSFARRIFCTDDHPFDEGHFVKHFLNGWATGWRNFKGKRHVLPTEAASEATSLFGAPVRMQTNKDKGRTTAYILTVGDRSEEISNLNDKAAVLGLLAQMGECDADTLGQSPLVLDGTWWTAFKQCLHVETAYTKVLGDDIDEFYEALRQLARDAAKAGRIGDTLVKAAAPRADGSGIDQFKPWLMLAGGEVTLLVPARLMQQKLSNFSGVSQKVLVDLGEKKKQGIHFWAILMGDTLDADRSVTRLVSARDLELKQAALKGGTKND